jgi:hypothetical protein
MWWTDAEEDLQAIAEAAGAVAPAFSPDEDIVAPALPPGKAVPAWSCRVIRGLWWRFSRRWEPYICQLLSPPFRYGLVCWVGSVFFNPLFSLQCSVAYSCVGYSSFRWRRCGGLPKRMPCRKRLRPPGKCSLRHYLAFLISRRRPRRTLAANPEGLLTWIRMTHQFFSGTCPKAPLNRSP